MISAASNTEVWHCTLVLVCPALIIIVVIGRRLLSGRFQRIEGYVRYQILLCVLAKEASFSGQLLAVNLLCLAWCDILNKWSVKLNLHHSHSYNEKEHIYQTWIKIDGLELKDLVAR